MTKLTMEEYTNLKNLLDKRIDEIIICVNNKAYFAAMMLVGSTVEGVLYLAATKYSNQNNIDDWSFYSLINWAKNLNIISDDTKTKLLTLKDVRNYIHIQLEYKNQDEIDENKLKDNVKILKQLVDDLFNYAFPMEGYLSNATK